MSNNQPLNVLITGGLGGIGQGIINTLVSRGDRVFVFDKMPPESVLTPQTFHYQQINITDNSSIKDGFVTIDRELNDQCLHVLINNAGITRDTLAIRMQEQDWDDVINVNLKGSFLCAQQALLRMIKNKPLNHNGTQGYLINMSSIVGIKGNAGQANYAASKAGLIALTQTLAAEYASRKILVNAIAPGFIQTPMTDRLPANIKEQVLTRIGLNRLGTPGDIAAMIGFLTSGSADYITGQIITIDGGMR